MNEATGQSAPDQGFHWRIAVISDAVPGSSALAPALVSALRDLGHHVLDVDAVRHQLLDSADGTASGGEPTVARIRLDRCTTMVDAFAPQLVVAAGRPMGFDDGDARVLKAAGRVLVGVVPTGGDRATEHGFLATHDVVASPDAGQAPGRFWRDLLTRLQSEADSLPGLETSRRDEIRRVLSPTLPRAKKVIVSGYYGAGNLGDELILTSITQALQRADPAVQVTVAADRPLNVERTHGLQSYSRPDHVASLHEVRTAAAVVLGGGGLWHDYSFAQSGGLMGFFTGARMSIAGYGILPLMARMLGRGFHVVGMGVGPLTTPEVRGAVRFLAEQADSIYVRERESAELLASLPVPAERIVTGPDVVYGVELPSSPARSLVPPAVRHAIDNGYTLVGLNLRTWAAGDMDALVRETVAALTDYAEQHRIAVVSVPMQWGKDRDQAMVQRVLDGLPATVPALGFDHRPSLEELCALYAELGVVVSMRLHSALLAHRCGVPVVGFGYDPKVGRHFDEVGRSAFCLPLEAEADRIRGVLSTALAKGLPASARAVVRELERSAREALAVAAEQIATTPAPDVLHTPPVLPASPHRTGAAAPAAPAQPPAAVGTDPGTPAARFVFTGMELTTAGIDTAAHAIPSLNPERLGATPGELRLSLATDRPRRGMAVAWTGQVAVEKARGNGAHEVELVVDNHWANAKARGRVFVEIEAGASRWREDLSLRRDSVRLRLLVPGGAPLAVSFRLVVVRKAFRSASWGSATSTRLTVGRVNPIPEVQVPQLLASSGEITSAS